MVYKRDCLPWVTRSGLQVPAAAGVCMTSIIEDPRKKMDISINPQAAKRCTLAGSCKSHRHASLRGLHLCLPRSAIVSLAARRAPI